jgi:hypothetical protein
MSHTLGPELIGYIRDYRNQHGSSLLAAKAAVLSGWRPGDSPPPPDPRDAKIALLEQAHLGDLVLIDEMRKLNGEFTAEITTLRAERNKAREDLGWMTRDRDDLAGRLADVHAGCDIQRGDTLYRQVKVVIGPGKTQDQIEIDRLTKEYLLRAQAMEVERDAARAECSRLQDALRGIHRCCSELQICHACRDAARAALSEGK